MTQHTKQSAAPAAVRRPRLIAAAAIALAALAGCGDRSATGPKDSEDPQVGKWEGKLKRDAISLELDLLADGHPIVYRFEK